jgi:hypothetical protein
MDVIFIRDFIPFSSFPSNSKGRAKQVKSSVPKKYNVSATIVQYHIDDSFASSRAGQFASFRAPACLLPIKLGRSPGQRDNFQKESLDRPGSHTCSSIPLH